MSAAVKLAGALERDLEKLAAQRFVPTSGAALIAGCHPETVRDAARAGLLHGSQPLDPVTGKPQRGGRWKFRPACVEAWVEGLPCDHQEVRRPVSLAEFKGRTLRGVR